MKLAHIGRRASAAALLTLSGTAVSCGGDDSGESQAPGASDGASTNPDTAWGPLAVVPGDGAGSEALIQGTLRITDDCVFLNEQGNDVLLAWPEDRTSWAADTGTISFQRRDDQRVELTDGDDVRLAGGGSSASEGGGTAGAALSSVEWASEPSPACATDTYWFIEDLVG